MNYYKAMMEAMAAKKTEAVDFKEPPITPPNYEHDEEPAEVSCSICGATKNDDDLLQVSDDDQDIIMCRPCYDASVQDGDLAPEHKATEIK